MSGSAILSDCGTYRYRLTRETGSGTGICNFVMLNPSTADATADDPTIRRCVGFARSWGYERLVVTNLFAFRATNPAVLEDGSFVDVVGPRNDRNLIDEAERADIVVCAWGCRGEIQRRGERVREMLGVRPLHVLRLTAKGHPSHPLYLPAMLRPVVWSEAASR